MADDSSTGFFGQPSAIALMPQLQTAYQNDPRRSIVQALLAQSQQAQQNPMRTRFSALANALTAVPAALASRSLNQDYQDRNQAAQNTLAQALAAGQGSPAVTGQATPAQPAVAPEAPLPDGTQGPTLPEGQAASPAQPAPVLQAATAPDPQKMQQILASNPVTQPMALQMAQMQAQQQRELAMKNLAPVALREGEQYQRFDPVTGAAMAPVTNSNPLSAEGKSAQDAINAVKSGSPLAAALLAGVGRNATGIAGTTIDQNGNVINQPGAVQAGANVAGANANAVVPAKIAEAVGSAAGTAPIHVQEAINTAAGVAPININTAAQEGFNKAQVTPQEEVVTDASGNRVKMVAPLSTVLNLPNPPALAVPTASVPPNGIPNIRPLPVVPPPNPTQIMNALPSGSVPPISAPGSSQSQQPLGAQSNGGIPKLQPEMPAPNSAAQQQSAVPQNAPQPGQQVGAPVLTPEQTSQAETQGKNIAEAQKGVAAIDSRISNAKAIIQQLKDLAPKVPYGSASGVNRWASTNLGSGEDAANYGEFVNKNSNLFSQELPAITAGAGGRLDIPIVNEIKAASAVDPDAHPAEKIRVLNSLSDMLDKAQQNAHQNYAIQAGQPYTPPVQQALTLSAAQYAPAQLLQELQRRGLAK